MVWNLRASENSEMRAFAKATRTDSEVALLQSIKNQVPVENLSLYVHNVLNLSNIWKSIYRGENTARLKG